MTASHVKRGIGGLGEIQIEKDIPVPSENRGGNRNRISKYPFDKMEVGDSFFVPGYDCQQFSSRISTAQLRTGYTFTGRTSPEGVRIWRIK